MYTPIYAGPERSTLIGFFAKNRRALTELVLIQQKVIFSAGTALA
jgi:hypothetical protein